MHTTTKENDLSDDAGLAPSAEQDAFSSETGMVQLNKEQWQGGTFGDNTAEMRTAYEPSG